MPAPNRLHPISSTCKFFAVLMLALVLVSAYAVNAQDNTNNANGNAGNTNGNTNTNVNQSGNVNGNVNGNSNQTESGASANLRAEIRRDELVKTNWFYALVSLMFAIVLVPFALTIMRAIRFSRATYSSPLGLPDGSLRAMLAYTLVAYLGFYILASVLSLSDFKPPDFLLGIVATVIGFYFGSRTGEDRGAGTAPRTGTVNGTVVDRNGTPAVEASVELSQSGVKKFTQTADTNGKYKFDNIPAGDYEIQASAEGSEPSDRTRVTVKAGATQAVNLKLK